MVEEYDSIVGNSVLDMVPRQENKSIVSSHWLYKVNQAADGSVIEIFGHCNPKLICP